MAPPSPHSPLHPSSPRAFSASVSSPHNSTRALSNTHTGPTGRVFAYHSPTPCYDVSPSLASKLIPPSVLTALQNPSSTPRVSLLQREIPARDVVAVRWPRHTILRLSVPDGPQVADVNIWNAANPSEHFYSGKTRQLHASHLSTGDSLWSNLPHLRPLATIVKDTVSYGFDVDGASVHDVIGTRCDQYIRKYLTSPMKADAPSCHSNLVRAAKTFDLDEKDVHDVFNVFMCTGFDTRSGKYFTKPSPVRQGDYLEMFSHIDLLFAVGACPYGDVALACGSGGQPRCFPLEMEIFQVPADVLGDLR